MIRNKLTAQYISGGMLCRDSKGTILRSFCFYNSKALCTYPPHKEAADHRRRLRDVAVHNKSPSHFCAQRKHVLQVGLVIEAFISIVFALFSVWLQPCLFTGLIVCFHIVFFFFFLCRCSSPSSYKVHVWEKTSVKNTMKSITMYCDVLILKMWYNTSFKFSFQPLKYNLSLNIFSYLWAFSFSLKSQIFYMR